jgi:hypothetical protein
VFGGLAEASKARRRPHHMQGHLFRNSASLFRRRTEREAPDRSRDPRRLPNRLAGWAGPLSRRIVGAPIESIETRMLGGQSGVGGLYP